MAQSSLFEIHKLSLPGVFLIKPKIFFDIRGYSAVTYNVEEFLKLGIAVGFKQDFISHSAKNVIRGLHFQRAPYTQDKLVRCAQGDIFGVIADHDSASATFGTYVSATLTAEEQTMLYIPGIYALGFCVIREEATVEYKIGGEYSPKDAGGIPWNDPLFHIKWPISSPILSEQDKSWQPLLHKSEA